jgi:dsDNA-specific endonuclease/ATPase MutS2
MPLESKDSSNIMKRSFFSAYGPMIITSALTILAFTVLFLTNQPEGKSATSASQMAGTPPPEMNSENMGKRVDEVMQRTQGEWDKATDEEKEIVSRIAQGHAREMFQTYKDKLKNKKQVQPSGKGNSATN